MISSMRSMDMRPKCSAAYHPSLWQRAGPREDCLADFSAILIFKQVVALSTLEAHCT